MKKRILALLLAGVMMLGLAACGGSGDAGKNDTDGKTIKVGLICIGDENDQGYTYNFIRGKEAATKTLADKGINVEWVVKYNIGEDATCEDANIELAEEGCEIIINKSTGDFSCTVGTEVEEDNTVAGFNSFGTLNNGGENKLIG